MRPQPSGRDATRHETARLRQAGKAHHRAGRFARRSRVCLRRRPRRCRHYRRYHRAGHHHASLQHRHIPPAATIADRYEWKINANAQVGPHVALVGIMRNVFVLMMLPMAVAAQMAGTPPRALPATATAQLVQSLDAARQHTSHVWRDTPAMNDDGTVNAIYRDSARRASEVGIRYEGQRARDRSRDASRDWRLSGELRLRATNGVIRRRPFDVLVLGPRASRRRTRARRHRRRDVHGRRKRSGLESRDIAGGRSGRPRYSLSPADRKRIGGYFARYKQHEPGKFSKVPGWGSPADGLAHVQTAHAFFRECAEAVEQCVLW